MRARVAKSAGGHALEKRFLDLSELELSLLYMQAVKEENEKRQDTVDLVKVVNEAWTKKFDYYFDMVQLFSNPKLFKQKEELKKSKEFQKDINEDNFLEEWDKIMQVIPEQYVVEEPDPMKNVPQIEDPEFDELVAGWVENNKYTKG